MLRSAIRIANRKTNTNVLISYRSREISADEDSILVSADRANLENDQNMNKNKQNYPKP